MKSVLHNEIAEGGNIIHPLDSMADRYLGEAQLSFAVYPSTHFLQNATSQ
jgi:hypothetical protein